MKTLLILLLTCTLAWAKIPVRTYLTSSYLIPGETTSLVIETRAPISRDIQIPHSDLFDLQYQTRTPFSLEDRSIGYRYHFDLSSLNQGIHQIPSFPLEIAGANYQSQALEFEVHPSTSLNFQSVQIGNREITYATRVFLPERDLYVGETVPTEVKVYLPYLPRHYTVIETGLPEVKRDGMSAWRYHAARPPRSGPQPFLTSQGSYTAITYRSSAHALRAGEISLGGGNARPVFKAVSSLFGQTRWEDLPIYLPLEKISRTAIALPAGAPDSFRGAVGQYQLELGIEGVANASLDTPIALNIQVMGTGNLDKIEAPIITDSENWKVYEATKAQRDSERRYLSGHVEFTQLLRAKTAQRHLPAFAFSYFDPTKKEYVTLNTPKLPLQANASIPPVETAPQQKASSPATTELAETPPPPIADLEAIIPRENMADVLGLIPDPVLHRKTANPSLLRFWPILPALLALFLLVVHLRRYMRERKLNSPLKHSAKKALSELKAESEPIPFLKKAATFTDLLPESAHELKNEVTSLRDQACFVPDKSQSPLSTNDRHRLLKKLSAATKHLVLITMLSLVMTDQAQAQESPSKAHSSALAATDKQDYQTALSEYLNAYPELDYPADILYNIGTLYAKLDRPGQAMLYYRRALLQEPNHPEVQQNLNYLERVNGSIIIRRSGFYRYLSMVPLQTLKTTLYASLWFLLCALLALPLLPRSRFRISLWVCAFILAFLTPIIFSFILVYPSDGKFSPIHETAIITANDPVTARTGAASDAARVIIAPPGSPAKVILQRGLWAYLEFVDNTRAWVSTQDITMLAPSDSFQEVTPVEETPDL